MGPLSVPPKLSPAILFTMALRDGHFKSLPAVRSLSLSQKGALTETKVKQRPVSRGAGHPLPASGFSDVTHPDVAGVWRSPRGAFTVLQSTPGHRSSVRCCNKSKKN